MRLKNRSASSNEVSIGGDIQEMVDIYIYDTIIGGMIRDKDFINDCEKTITDQGITDEIENKVRELASIIKKAIDIADEKYKNY